jgi:pimeloyl-ACP methyl ester carboxylesterase
MPRSSPVAAAILIAAASQPSAQPSEPMKGELPMSQTIASTLKVPGASIYWEKRGHGPLLLIIPGGPQDAGVFSQFAQEFADRYTVVAYDPRGNSRSRFDGAPQPLDVDQQADDAAALIAAVGQGPALVFGTSGGAQIGLNLAARHPGAVKALVAHEPPTVMLLDDPSRELAGIHALQDTYRRDGVDAAMGEFFAANGLGEGDAPSFDEMPPEAAETFQRVSGNFEYWLAEGMLPLSIAKPDIDALRKGKPRIVVAIGEASVGQPIHAMGSALARKLGVQPVSFPGDHMGYETELQPFVGRLDEVLRQAADLGE